MGQWGNQEGGILIVDASGSFELFSEGARHCVLGFNLLGKHFEDANRGHRDLRAWVIANVTGTQQSRQVEDGYVGQMQGFVPSILEAVFKTS